MPRCATRGSLLHRTCWCLCAKAHYANCNGKEGMTAVESANRTGSSRIPQEVAVSSELTALLGTAEQRSQTPGREPAWTCQSQGGGVYKLLACLRSQRPIAPSDPFKTACFLPCLVVQGKKWSITFPHEPCFLLCLYNSSSRKQICYRELSSAP